MSHRKKGQPGRWTHQPAGGGGRPHSSPTKRPPSASRHWPPIPSRDVDFTYFQSTPAFSWSQRGECGGAGPPLPGLPQRGAAPARARLSAGPPRSATRFARPRRRAFSRSPPPLLRSAPAGQGGAGPTAGPLRAAASSPRGAGRRGSCPPWAGPGRSAPR